MYKSFGKRVLDILLASTLILCFAPVFAGVALLVLVFIGRPVFFVQRRPGKDERVFKVLKFRTMLAPTGPNGELLSESQRITGVGRFLRLTSLDELPQLINVIKGDMSFIGPRPLLEEYLCLYTPTERLRHSVRPGITGLAQIRGRNFLEPRQRLAADVEYVRNLSFSLDLKIFLQSIPAVLFQQGVQVCPAEQSAPFVPQPNALVSALEGRSGMATSHSIHKSHEE